MAPMVATLTKQDIEELAAYYSSQTPALSVVPKKVFFFSGKSSEIGYFAASCFSRNVTMVRW